MQKRCVSQDLDEEEGNRVRQIVHYQQDHSFYPTKHLPDESRGSNEATLSIWRRKFLNFSSKSDSLSGLQKRANCTEKGGNSYKKEEREKKKKKMTTKKE